MVKMNRLIKSNLCFAKVVVKEDTSPAIFYSNRGPWITLEVKLAWKTGYDNHIPINDPIYLKGTACPSTTRGEFLIRPQQTTLSFDTWATVDVNPRYFSHYTGKPIEMILYCSDEDQPVLRWIDTWKSRRIIVKGRKKTKSTTPMSSIVPHNKKRKIKASEYEELLAYAKKCYMALSSLMVEEMNTCLEIVPALVKEWS